MKAYVVRLFIPKVIDIQAEDEAQALEKVGELYKEFYAKDIRTWIELLEEPQERE